MTDRASMTMSKNDDDTDNSMAIDFHRMMLEERKRVKAERQRKKRLLKQKQEEKGENSRTQNKEDNDKKKSNENAIHCIFPSLPILERDYGSEGMACIISPSHLPTIRYSSTFLHSSYTRHLLSYLQSLPQTSYNASSESSSNGKWTLLPHSQRRVLLLDATTSSATYDLPLPILLIAQKTSSYFPPEYQPNHVLINEYDATGGIMPHTDGPCYFPTTVTISIGGGHVLLKFTPRDCEKRGKNNDEIHEVILDGNGSLICFANDMYTDYCHAIDEGVLTEQPDAEKCMNCNDLEKVQRGYRISLTFRHKFVVSC